MDFVYKEIYKQIRSNVIDILFPKLNNENKKMLTQWCAIIVESIEIYFRFYKWPPQVLYQKLKLNDYRDIKWIVTHILPYIDESKKDMKQIINLSDIFTKREDGMESINTKSPNYTYSNFQYGRFSREKNDYQEIDFSYDLIIQNCYLLINTIKKIRYKMHVNWTDIVPITLSEYRRSELFIDTVKKMKKKKLEDWNFERSELGKVFVDPIYFIEKTSGLNVEDIYDTISIDLYESIVNQKWLLFDVMVKRVEGNKENKFLIPVIIYLDTVLDLRTCIADIEWEEHNEHGKKDFMSKWDLLVMSYEKRIDTYLEDSEGVIIIPTKSIDIVMSAFTTFFEREYSSIRIAMKDEKRPYIPIDTNEKYLDLDILKKIDKKNIIPSLKTIDHKYAYDFLKETVQIFKSSWYSFGMMNNDKTEFYGITNDFVKGIDEIQSPPMEESFGDQKIYITYKNIYNFCKSFVHRKIGNKFVRYPIYWSQINDESKGELLNRLNDNDNRDGWFNITNNLNKNYQETKIFGNINYDDIKKLNNAIYLGNMENIIDIVFQSMITKGIMTKFRPSNDILNMNNYNTKDNAEKKILVERVRKEVDTEDNNDNAYYYMTNKPYGSDKFNIEIDEKITKMGYFDVIGNNSLAWYTLTPFYWMSQIGFCHRFIHNRVTYITGAPGEGKSTQGPKLYCYYMKALEHVNDPTICVTVPRIGITTKVSEYISKELALPYKNYGDMENKGKFTENYQIQFKNMREQRIKNGNFPKIRFITDGSILEISKDPLFSKKYVVNDNYVYIFKNEYDVLIIDEAHEHNVNMDMILTFMKKSIMYNNRLRLVIMSATIESDEPIYRRFYRGINDNRKYPVDRWIEKNKYDRVNVDRRFHFQHPGTNKTEGRYKITDYYVPNKDPLILVQDIIRKYSTGDILLFQPGSGDIAKAIDVLNGNNFLPDNVLAVPYYSKMGKNIDIVRDIDKNIKKIKIKKNQRFEDSDLFKGNNSYNRFVMVSTNIMEASSTISSLKFVIETGIEKVMVFDHISMENKIEEAFITEASRIQRRGRVGRNSDGIVFYTYEENKMIDNLKQFNISISDIHLSVLFNNLRNKNGRRIMTKIIDDIVLGKYDGSGNFVGKIMRSYMEDLMNESSQVPNNRLLDEIENYFSKHGSLNGIGKNKIKNFFDQMTSLNQVADKFVNMFESYKSIAKIIEKLYFINDEYYGYYGNDAMYDYKNDPLDIWKNSYNDGYVYGDLVDDMGNFYIIHPDELSLKRNIAGEVIGKRKDVIKLNDIPGEKYIKRFESDKMEIFWKLLRDKLFVESFGKTLLKTDYGMKISEIMSKVEISENPELVSLMCQGILIINDDNTFKNLVRLISIFDVTGMNIPAKTLKIFNKILSPPDDDIRPISYRKSDIDLILRITKIIEGKVIKKGYNTNFMESKYIKSGKFYEWNINGIIEGKMEGSMVTENSGNLRNEILENIFLDFSNGINTAVMDNEVSTFFKKLGLDQKIIKSYLIKKEKIRLKYNDYLMGIDSGNNRKGYDDNIVMKTVDDIRNKMKKINIGQMDGLLLMVYRYNVHKKLIGNNGYVSINNPINFGVKQFTSVDAKFASDYIINLSKDKNDVIKLLHYVNPKHLELIVDSFDIRKIKRAMNRNNIIGTYETLKSALHDIRRISLE
jgi:hypothetical protein